MTEDIIKFIKNGEEIVLTEKRLRELTSKFAEMAGKQASFYDDFGMSVKMLDVLIKIKQAWFPATQKNLNLNVNDFDKKLQAWRETRKELIEAQKETKKDKKKVIEVVKEEE